MLHLIATLAIAARVALPAEDSAQVRREELMAKLKNGGYSVLLRHARTDYSFKEEVGTMPKERNQQRNLSDDGIRDAALMGVVFRKYGIGFAEIIASPMFRTVETAEMSVGKPTITTMALRVIPSTPEQEALIKTAPKPGTNRILVTHHFVIEKHVPGVKPGDVGESEAAVVKHNADGTIQLVGLIKLDDWKALSNPGYGKPQAAPSPATTAVFSHGAPPPERKPSGLPTEIPSTMVGQLARGYVSAFNSGDATKMRVFMEASFVADPARPTEERVKTYTKLFEDFGVLSLASQDSSTATLVTLGFNSKKGLLVLTLKTSDADPHRIGSVTFASRENR
jgi:phosphohistidine phosphatase SixA